MRTLYIDCFSGASGDMFLGALVDLGVDVAAISAAVDALGLEGVRIETRRVERSGLTAVKANVLVGNRMETVGGQVVDAHDHGTGHDHGHAHDAGHSGHEHHHAPSVPSAAGHAHEHGRSAAEILQLIQSSQLPERIRLRAASVFTRIAQAEARAHGTRPDQVHFHEVGAADAIVDVVGTLVGLEMLAVEKVIGSTVRIGGGEVTFSHGTYPVPTPATAELLRGLPISSGPVDVELVTPTGAALLAEIVDDWEPLDGFRIERVGYGAGTRDFPGRPNVLRLCTGSSARSSEHAGLVGVIEAVVDDTSPEVMGYFLERVLADGALDAYFTPVQMKKNRPGVAITVMTEPERLDDTIRLVFRETTTIGVRHRLVARTTLDRETATVETPFGPIRIKLSRLDGETVSAAPEFDDCREAARRTGAPIRQIFEAASAAYMGERHGKQ